jgi:multidrug efflux system membrane fusion protein
VAAAEEELARTVIRAPIAGTIEQPIAEIGETLSIGDTCATIVDADPILVTGQVTERDVSDIELGTVASVELVTGEKAEGEVTFVSRTADPDTRTFTVEITLANADGALRAGVTAEARIPLQPARVHRLSPGVLTLADSGEVGVRTVDDEGRVAFRPVEIAMQDTEGFWVTGLPQTVTVITVGQDFVVEGQIVEPIKDTEDA